MEVTGANRKEELALQWQMHVHIADGGEGTTIDGGDYKMKMAPLASVQMTRQMSPWKGLRGERKGSGCQGI